MSAGIFTVAVGYAYLAYGNASTRTDITDIKAAQTVAISTTQSAIKEQDERRTQLGKQFLESNEKIATAVGTLATQMAVQQERQKSADEKLEKVLNQIGMALAPAPLPLPAPRR